VPPVVPHQNSGSRTFRRVAKANPGLYRMRDRLLDQRGDARRDAFATLRLMELVGTRHYDAIDTTRCEQFRKRRMQRHAGLPRNFARCRCGIDDRCELA
jgi:hypothetical protein